MDSETRDEMRALELPGGKTSVFQSGDGPPLLVVHGGPGMEHSYLRTGLAFLEDAYSVYYYDQVGTGRDPRPCEEATVEALRSQLREMYSYVAAEHREPVTVLAHSWGTLLTLLEEPWSEHDGVRVVLVSPMGFTWDRCVAAVNRFSTRVSDEDMGRIAVLEELGTREAGVEEMEILMPYYVSPTVRIPVTGLRDYRSAVNDRIITSLSGYDVRSNAQRLPNSPIVLQGDYDFHHPEDVVDDLPPKAIYRLLQDAGHFPFLERPRLFQTELMRLLSTHNA